MTSEDQNKAVYHLCTRLIGEGWALHRIISKASIPELTGIPHWNVPPVIHVRGCAEIYAAKLRSKDPHILCRLVETK